MFLTTYKTKSSAIAELGVHGKDLIVVYKSNQSVAYQFKDAGSHFNDMMAHPSKGIYAATYITGQYQSVKHTSGYTKLVKETKEK